MTILAVIASYLLVGAVVTVFIDYLTKVEVDEWGKWVAFTMFWPVVIPVQCSSVLLAGLRGHDREEQVTKTLHRSLVDSWVGADNIGYGTLLYSLWIKAHSAPVCSVWTHATGCRLVKHGNVFDMDSIYTPEWCRRRGYARHTIQWILDNQDCYSMSTGEFSRSAEGLKRMGWQLDRESGRWIIHGKLWRKK
jgi:hypothetical protein